MSDSTTLPPLEPLIDQLAVRVERRDLLELALTHRSFLNENETVNADNERLEFLGDAVLDYAVGSYLFRRFPTMAEGELTALRAALVRAETLAAFAQQLTIDQHLRLGYGEAESGGRERIPTLCAAFEAVVGAIYLDQGMDVAVNLIERLSDPMLRTIREQSLHKDAKSEFQMWAQAEFSITPRYVVVAEEGPDHAKLFTVRVIVGDRSWGEGSGTSKRRAEQEAAASALNAASALENALDEVSDSV